MAAFAWLVSYEQAAQFLALFSLDLAVEIKAGRLAEKRFKGRSFFRAEDLMLRTWTLGADGVEEQQASEVAA